MQQRALGEIRAGLRHGDDARLWVGETNIARVGEEFTDENAQERGLASAVGAHEADAFAGNNLEIEVGDEHLAAHRVGDALGGDEFAGLASACGEIDASAAARSGVVALGQTGEFGAAFGAFADARLRLGAPRLGTAPEPAIIFAHGVCQGFLRARLHLQELGLAAAKLRIVSIDRKRAFGIGA